ncbi:MAG: prepilin-type N-terminal cleavage/methylation domain-containing protein [Dictyoglomus sp.]|nr:prepilin-type N-terminal cleavage/methylation domain-containing protein [Dictyoglomus sp.]MCX7942321.1 prepilin-type N-terminal cleavage/methylation domain-containing protein [Dictyoglomaceae bacterium]MDW8188876.1 Ada metal-binding domain-containing protein [Dictyoglomus sp.]
MKNKKGFTLTELLIFILITGIIITITIPIYWRSLEEAKKNSQHSNIDIFTKRIEYFALKNGRYPTPQEFTNILNDSNYFSEIPKCSYNGKSYTLAISLSNFRNAMQNNNFNNANILYYEASQKTYTLWYYPPRFYIGNKITKIFHYPWCWTLPSPVNQILLPSREEAIEKSFTSCSNCKP